MKPHLMTIAKTAAIITSILALVAAVFSIPIDASKIAENSIDSYWRIVGLFTFSALFALLALKDTLNFRLWEIVIGSKVALVILSLTVLSPVEGSQELLLWDGLLVVILSVGYIAARMANKPQTA